MLQPFNIDERIKLAAYMHHERIDGSGYPQGIKDEQIVPFAKIIALLDSYEAMTSYRSYRAPLCPFTVIEIFERDGYGKYDTGFYITFLERMVEEYIGKEVQLSDGTICEVILINKQKYSRPMVKTTDGKYIDLATQKDLSIKALV
jgi:HD-GYP domain-containing protein (c-di-GMP phosphodiesterase class II)